MTQTLYPKSESLIGQTVEVTGRGIPVWIDETTQMTRGTIVDLLIGEGYEIEGMLGVLPEGMAEFDEDGEKNGIMVRMGRLRLVN